MEPSSVPRFRPVSCITTSLVCKHHPILSNTHCPLLGPQVSLSFFCHLTPYSSSPNRHRHCNVHSILILHHVTFFLQSSSNTVHQQRLWVTGRHFLTICTWTPCLLEGLMKYLFFNITGDIAGTYEAQNKYPLKSPQIRSLHQRHSTIFKIYVTTMI